jgi:hypothetical protein
MSTENRSSFTLSENKKILLASLIVFITITLFTFTTMSAAELPPVEITDTTERTVTEIKTDTDYIKIGTTEILDIIGLPNLKVWGTEYIPGDNMTIWLQLLDDERQPIENSTCFSKVWYPDTTQWNGYRGMTFLDEGIHYLFLSAPSYDGVYPISAMCYMPGIEDYSQTYYYDDGSSSAEQLLGVNDIYAHNFTYENPDASNVDMCAWLRVTGTPTLYWTVNTTSIQQVTGATTTGQWVCNPISNLSWFNFIGDQYFGVTCTDCGGGTRAYLGQDADLPSPPNSYIYTTSWGSDNDIFFIRLNVTDISAINETEYIVIKSSGEIHVNRPYIQDIWNFLTGPLSTVINNTNQIVNSTYNYLVNLNITGSFQDLTFEVQNSTTYLSDLVLDSTQWIWNGTLPSLVTDINDDIYLLKMMSLCSPTGFAIYGASYFQGSWQNCSDFYIEIRRPPEPTGDGTWIDTVNEAVVFLNETTATNYYLAPLHDFLNSTNPMNASRMGILESGLRIVYGIGYFIFKGVQVIF